ncbi:hyalin-like [Amphiura filiformis]|uniref:hyalin-like n=1 Tax=Amphiura filiformis TaxID=82378 RepID=UPI003B219BB2
MYAACTAADDTTPPVITGCPTSAIRVTAPVGSNFATAFWTEPTATDNSGETPTRSRTHAPGWPFAFSITRVTYRFFDASLNVATCQFDVTVSTCCDVDIIPPVITGCPNTVRVSAPTGSTSAIATWTEPRATDNSGDTPIRTRTHTPGSPFPIGTTTVTYRFFDASGNIATCQFDVIVTSSGVDNIPPVITGCPNTVRVSAPAGSNTATATWTEPRATDNSGDTPTRTRTHTPGSPFPIGRTVVTYRFFDASGNIATCQFDVIVTSSGGVGNIVVSNCPNDLNMIAPQGSSFYQANWEEPSAIDTNGGVVSVMASRTPPRFFTVPSENEITYTFSNAAGDEAVCMFTVSVSTSGVDNIPPVITGCPNTVRVSAPAGSNTATATWTEPRATDNSGDTPTRTRTHTPGSTFPIGRTVVTYRFFDASGNIATCQFDVIVTSSGGVGNIVVSNCPNDLNMIAPQGSSFYQANWEEPSAIDTNGGVVSVMASHTPPRFFTVPSENEITYTFSNDAGDEAVCMFTVSVSSEYADFTNITYLPIGQKKFSLSIGPIRNGPDITPPEVRNCPESFEVQTQPGETAATASWTEPTATDDSEPVTSTRSHSPGQIFPPGMTVVTYEFFDAVRNRNTCTFIITVTDGGGVDTTPPVVSNCPADITKIITPPSTSTQVTWTPPTATDDSGITPIRFSSHDPGNTFNQGITFVTYTFMDAAGNEATPCVFSVTVQGTGDNTPPVVTFCPDNIIREVPPGTTGTIVTWSEPIATDNSGVDPVVTRTHVSGTRFTIGTDRVTYTFTDGSSNRNTCSFMVTVREYRTITLDSSQVQELQRSLDELIAAMGGQLDLTRLDEEQFYTQTLVNLTEPQEQEILDSCIGTEIFRARSEFEQTRSKRQATSKICETFTPQIPNLVTFAGNNLAQVNLINNMQQPWVINERCRSSFCRGGFAGCSCGRVSRSVGAYVMVIPLSGSRRTPYYGFRTVNIYSCSALI